MKNLENIRVPGVAWALLIIIIVAVVHENESSIPVDPFWIDLVLGSLIAILKTLTLDEDQLTRALEVIDKLLAREVTGPPMRGVIEPVVTLEEIPQKQDPMTRWLFG